MPSPRRCFAADRGRYLRTRRTVGSPRRRHPHHHTGAFQLRHILEKSQSFTGFPTKRMEDLARIDHLP